MNRSPNERFRTARLSLPSPSGAPRAMSRKELADQVNDYLWHEHGVNENLNQHEIGRIERGEVRWPGKWRRLGLRAVLAATSDTDLGFYFHRRLTNRPAPEPTAWTDTAGAASIIDDWLSLVSKPEGDTTNRRQVLAGGALGLLGAATASLTSRFPDYPQSERPATVDPAIVDHFAALRALLVDSDNRLGAAWVLPAVQHQLAMIAQLRRQSRNRLHDELLSTESRWAEFAGWLNDDLGDRTAGAWWLSQSISMAQEANDRDFSAYLFARLAQRAAGGDDEDRVPGLAHAATSVDTSHSRVRTFATLQRALGHALVGEIREFESAIDHARTLVESHTAPPDDLGSFCTASYILAQEAEGWLCLGHPKAAVSCLSEALATWPASYQRDRGLYLARAAAAHLADEEPDQAATLAFEALTLADFTQSSRVGRQVVALGQQLTRFGDRPAVAQLQDALNTSTVGSS